MIATSNLSVQFGGRKLFDEVDIKFTPGNCYGIIGPNGAGKSTLLNQMIGFTKPDQGDILYGDISFIYNRKQARTLISYMSQQYAPLDKLTVEQNLEILGKMRGLSSQELEKAISQLLTDLEIEDYRYKKGKDLSGGLKRLTSFAMTLIGSSDIILLDEQMMLTPFVVKSNGNYCKS